MCHSVLNRVISVLNRNNPYRSHYQKLMDLHQSLVVTSKPIATTLCIHIRPVSDCENWHFRGHPWDLIRSGTGEVIRECVTWALSRDEWIQQEGALCICGQWKIGQLISPYSCAAWSGFTISHFYIVSENFVWLFVLRFYGPVNPMGSCRARSVYLTTRLLGRLSPLSG